MSIRIVVVTFLLSIEGACGRKHPVDRKVTSPSSCRANLLYSAEQFFCICTAEQVTLAAEPPMLRGRRQYHDRLIIGTIGKLRP